MFKKSLILFLTILMILPLISSAPPITIVVSDEGYNVWATMHDAIRIGSNYEWEVHVSNRSNGMPIVSGIVCYGNLYNESGNHIGEVTSDTVSHDWDYSLFFDSGNFTERGQYIIKIGCNSSVLGGGAENSFYVNDYGEMLTEEEQSMFNMGAGLLLIFLIVAVVGAFKIEHYIGKFTCYWFSHILFIILTFSVWQFTQGYAMGYVGLAGLFKVLFYVSIIAVFPMILLSLAWIFWIHTMTDEVRSMMDRGMKSEEAWDRVNSKKKGWFGI